ncbi:hypothetical protein ACN4EG_21935 [Alkalinema pantanalense CENA528]|uniref:hypothetical protein n=1 Tax=Alkalinema pantanalense TaxID=1620705 RepID=UPI003D6E2EDF
MKRFTPPDVRASYKGRVIAVGGPPHSGKSVFLNALHNALLQQMGDRVFLERACPDGEGKWSAEADPQLVQQLRQKSNFSPEFMQMKLFGIENLGRNKSLVLLDLGGRRSPENAAILAKATDLIILSSQPSEFAPWEAFATAQGCPVLLKLQSVLQRNAAGSLDTTARSSLDFSTDPATGCMVNLDRATDPDCYIHAIQQLSLWMASF